MIGREEEALLQREGVKRVFPQAAVVLLPSTIVLGVVSLGVGSWLESRDVRYYNYTGSPADHDWDRMGWKEGVWAGVMVSVFEKKKVLEL